MKFTTVFFVTFCLTLFIGLIPDEIKGSSKNPLFWKNVFKDATALKIGKRQDKSSLECYTYGTRGYYGVDTRKTFEYAQRFCENYGLSLVHIVDGPHNKWLLKTFNIKLGSLWWIGLRDTYNRSRIFKWNNKVPLTYTNWAPGHPKGERSLTIVTMLSSSGLWLSMSEDFRHHFICEENSSICKNKPLWTCEVYDSRAHYFLKIKSTFDRARTYCFMSIKGSLVWIRDKAHNNWLSRKVKTAFSSGNYIFIGLADIKHREFKWTDGQNLTFSLKKSDGYEYDFNCVYMLGNNWYDDLCIRTKKFICESRSPCSGIVWGEWSAWEPCSRSCGGGTQQRSRSCSDPTLENGESKCVGNTTETKNCSENHCPINGNWGTWSAWESCTTTCDVGTQKRSRSCNDPAPQYSGSDCVGNSTETQNCIEVHCSIHGNWGTWSAWTYCTTNCGKDTHQRSRLCDDPAPQFGGKFCEGKSIETENCDTFSCIIDGFWSVWTAWSQCSKTCIGGSRERFRYCNNPKPLNGGKNCAGGIGKEDEVCNAVSCKKVVAMKLEDLQTDKILNNDSFFTGDIIQCSPSLPYAISTTWIKFSCSSTNTIVLNCEDNLCQLTLNFKYPYSKTCKLFCNGTVADTYIGMFNVVADEVSIIPNENITLKLSEVNSEGGNLRESNYHVKCSANRLRSIDSLYIVQDCNNDKMRQFSCDKMNCVIKISVDNRIAYCNISCQAILKDNSQLNKLKIDWKIVCIMPQWSEWSSCTQSCDNGWQTRERVCTSPLVKDSEGPCYEADSRVCATDKKCEEPDDDPPFYFPPRKPRRAKIRYIWDITPSQLPPPAK